METSLKIHALALTLLGMPGLDLYAQSNAGCSAIPPGDADPPVMVCELHDRYVFRIAGEQSTFDKSEWRARARHLIADYGAVAGIPTSSLAGGHVTFWLSVPESSPADAHGRAIVTAGKYTFIVNLPVGLDMDVVTRQQVADLDHKEYPQYLGHRVGSILVKKAPGYTEQDFARHLKRCGATGVGETAGGWTSVLTRDFDESRVLRNLTKEADGKQMVAGANLNSIFEWIAWREPVFEFSLGENPVHVEPVTNADDGT